MLLPVVLVMAIGSPLAGRRLDRTGSRTVVLIGAAVLAAGLLMVGGLPISVAVFYLTGVLVGLGLSWLLGAPLRYIMLNEAPRPSPGGAGRLALSTRVGQLVGGALVGAVAASHGGGTAGYQQAFLGVGVITLVCFFAAFGLKNRPAELATVQRNEAQAAAETAATAAAAPAWNLTTIVLICIISPD